MIRIVKGDSFWDGRGGLWLLRLLLALLIVAALVALGVTAWALALPS